MAEQKIAIFSWHGRILEKKLISIFMSTNDGGVGTMFTIRQKVDNSREQRSSHKAGKRAEKRRNRGSGWGGGRVQMSVVS